MNTKYVLYAAILVIIIVSASAIVYVNMNNPSSSEGTISITDDEGYTTTLDGVPQRIVSMAPANTQFLFDLGVGNRVVGVTDYDDYPYDFSAWFEAGNMTSIGGFYNPSLEVITSLQPDLILGTTIHDDILDNLRGQGFKVIITDPTNIEDIYNDITFIGKAVGAEENATTLISNIQGQISEVQEKIANITEKPTVYWEVYFDESGITTAGADSWLNDVIAKAGGTNLFADLSGDYVSTSSEVIVQRNPDVIMMPEGMGSSSSGGVEAVKARPGWNTINAVIDDHIYIFDEDLFNRPTSNVGLQVQQVAACLYPTLISPPEL
ncbi:MAG: ABC transporter substrate-binding protein [Candidatus Bathyarchaeota archaeon]|nr:ABC transporter substrate-binding protein [Candidatus Bathyarchaeota archaeon]